jgi:hypothetical protein
MLMRFLNNVITSLHQADVQFLKYPVSYLKKSIVILQTSWCALCPHAKSSWLKVLSL